MDQAHKFRIKTLKTRLAIANAVVISCTIIGFAFYIATDRMSKDLSSVRQQLHSASTNVAAVTVNLLATKRFTELENVILQSVKFPGISSICLHGPDGVTLVLAELQKDGSWKISRPTGKIVLPTNPMMFDFVQDNNMQVWHPVISDTLLAWIELRYDISKFEQQRQDLMLSSLTIALLGIGGSLFFFNLFTKGSFQSIKQAANFATSLSEIHGETIQVDRSCREVELLGESLNLASKNLYNQQKEIYITAARLAMVLDAIVDGVVTMDASGKILSINSAGIEMFGFDASEIEGKNISVITDIDQDKVKGLFRELAMIYTQQNTMKIVFSGVRKNGSNFPLEFSLATMRDGDDQIAVGLLRDLSDVEILDRMKNEFVSNVSHEIRTPLTSIKGSLELLAGGELGELSEPAERIVNVARKNANTLLMLTNDLLDVEKMLTGNMEFNFDQVDLVEIVEETVVANMSYANKYNVKLELTNSDFRVIVRGDKLRITQVLNNLISNACKFSPEGETVNIFVERDRDIVKVKVQNPGAGIDSKFHNKIFQKFTQAEASSERQKGGTGLGLNICKSIIEHHHGTLSFTSTPGHGATFYFVLAISEELQFVGNG